jgi:vitamin B12 transporter
LISHIPQSIVTISKKDIEQNQFKNLSEVLEAISGIYVARSGTLGSITSTFIRGAESNHTVILIDGMRIVSSNDGQVSIGQIPLNSVDKIEIIKGGASTAYGADAVGGVINIITKSHVQKTENELTITAGNLSTKEIDFSHSQSIQGYKLNFGLNKFNTKGFDAKTPPDDADGFNKKSLFLSISKDFDDLSLSLKTSSWTGDSNYDGGWSGDTQHFENYFVNFATTYFLEKHSIKAITNIQSNRSTEYFEGSPVSSGSLSKVNNKGFDLSVNSLLNKNYSQTLGYSYFDERTATQSRYNQGIHWLGEISLNQSTDLQLGLRRDFSSQYGSNNTWSSGIVRRFGSKGRIFANYRTSFSPATFLDLNPAFYNPTPDPLPEKAKSLEIGSDININRTQKASLTLFETKFKDKIAYESGTMINIDKAKAKGIDVSFINNWERATLKVSHVVTIAEDDQGAQLLKRPKYQTTLNMNYHLNDKTKFTIRGEYLGQIASSGTTDKISYTLWAASLNHNFNDNFSAGIRVENIFDKEYSPLYGYNGRPQYLEASLKYKF